MRIIHIPKRITNPCLASLPSGLIAYYKLEESSGAVIDSIGGKNLTAYGSVARAQTGKLGNCLSFDGTNNCYCEGASPMAGLTEWTVSCWVKFTNIPIDGNQRYFISGDSIDTTKTCTSLGVGGTGSERIFHGYNGWGGNAMAAFTGVVPVLNTWYLVTHRFLISAGKMTFKNSVNNIHENGWVDIPTTAVSGGGTLIFGRWWYFNFGLFMGSLDDVKIWNRRISDCEIEANYNSGNGVVL